MSYRRRQRDLERQERKKRRDFKRNYIAKELYSPKYNQRIVKDKTKYNRKIESNRNYDE